MIAYNLFQVTFIFSNQIDFYCHHILYTDPVLCLDVLCELDLFWILPWQSQVQLALWACKCWICASFLSPSSDLCQVDYSDNPDSLRILSLAWWYFFSKFVDLLDTFFFVARYNDMLWKVLYCIFCEGKSTAMCRLCMWSTIALFPGFPGGDQSEISQYDVKKFPPTYSDLLGVARQHLVPS